MKEIIHLPKRPTIRLICDEPGSGFDWKQLIEPMKNLADVADIMVMLLDSLYLSRMRIGEYRDRAKKALDMYGQYAKIFEIGNEIGGEWVGDQGPTEAKCNAALEVFESARKWSAVTWYADGTDHMNQFFNAVTHMDINADFQLVSWYPYYSPGMNPDWNAVFQFLANAKPGRRYGFGEFGTEHEAHGEEVVAPPAARAALVNEMYRVAPTVPGFIGGGFYWRGWQDVLAKPNPQVRLAVQKSWHVT